MGTRTRIGTWFVAAALLLTWPLHLGPGALLLSDMVGALVNLGGYKDLVMFVLAGAGGGITILLAVGILVRYRLSLYVSAAILLGGLATLSRIFPQPSRDWVLRLDEWIACVSLTLLLILSAAYLLWLTRDSALRSKRPLLKPTGTP